MTDIGEPLAETFEGEQVRVSNGDRTLEGRVEEIGANGARVLLRDATGEDDAVGAAFIAGVTSIVGLEETDATTADQEPADGETPDEEPGDAADAEDEPNVDRGETVAVEEPDGDGETDDRSEAPPEDDLGTYEVKAYSTTNSLTLGRSVSKRFESQRASVRERAGQYELVPGEVGDWPDYSVGDGKIQVGKPGLEVLGADPGDEVRAIDMGDFVHLEIVGQEDDQPDKADEEEHANQVDADEFWCGYCGKGDFESEQAVRDHHDAEDHPGVAIVKTEDPKPDDDGDDAPTVSRADGGATAASVGESRTCQNCGSHVSKDYARVHAPDAEEDKGPRVCPNCPDKIRDGSEVREARAPRRNGGSS